VGEELPISSVTNIPKKHGKVVMEGLAYASSAISASASQICNLQSSKELLFIWMSKESSNMIDNKVFNLQDCSKDEQKKLKIYAKRILSKVVDKCEEDMKKSQRWG
jgi:glutamate mutase epsilon subunit